MNIWELSDLATPWCVHVAVTLRVAEHIKAGANRIDELAEAAGADRDALAQLLRHLISKGVFLEPAPGTFELNEAAQALLAPPARYGLNLDSFGGRMANAWSGLLQAVRTGAPHYASIFGRPFWEDLEAHPPIAEEFDALMGPGHGTPDPNVLLNDDWERVQTIVDVGGGAGFLLAEVLRVHPHTRGILVDLPRTIARSSVVFRQAGVAERATAVGQSFFEPLPQGADLYLLKSILSDWPDKEVRLLLTRCAEAARPNGRIVLLNGVTPHETPAPALLMLVLVGGRERTLAEFRTMAQASGLAVTASARQASGRFVVECRPIAPSEPPQ